MHPIMGYQAKKAQIADLHRQAERDRPARPTLAARKDSNTLQAPGHRAAALARRVLAVLGGRHHRHQPKRRKPRRDREPAAPTGRHLARPGRHHRPDRPGCATRPIQ